MEKKQVKERKVINILLEKFSLFGVGSAIIGALLFGANNLFSDQ